MRTLKYSTLFRCNKYIRHSDIFKGRLHKFKPKFNKILFIVLGYYKFIIRNNFISKQLVIVNVVVNQIKYFR